MTQPDPSARISPDEPFREALRDSGIILARTDLDLRYTWVHDPHPDFDPDAVIGRRDDEILPSDQARGISALKQRALDTGRLQRGKIEIQLSDGLRHWEMSARPLWDERGEMVGLTTAALDVTERQRAEEAFRCLAENTLQGLVLLKDRKVVYVNRRVEEITGYGPADLEGLPQSAVENVLHPEDRERAVRLAREAYSEGERVSAEPIRLLHRDGGERSRFQQHPGRHHRLFGDDPGGHGGGGEVAQGDGADPHRGPESL